MFKTIMYIGIIGMIVGAIMSLFLSRNKLTNGSEIPLIAEIGLCVFIISILLAFFGGFCSSELGQIILN